ncbi:MAG: hypothetical protein KKB34_10270 [Bacteroidetes bacterium]|nr:hypothetical protein [Bacteroidota bacterium]
MSVNVNNIVDDVFLQRAGNKLIFIIRRRTNKGIFLPGSSKRANQYSSKPFAMPVYSATKMLGSNIIKAAKTDPDNYNVFKSKAGNLWVLVKKGYKEIRRKANKFNDHVTMQFTANYIRDLSVLRTAGNVSELGWKNARNQRLATYHEVMGAGKSRRLHKILGMLKTEEDEMQAYIEAEFIKKLRKVFK